MKKVVVLGLPELWPTSYRPYASKIDPSIFFYFYTWAKVLRKLFIRFSESLWGDFVSYVQAVDLCPYNNIRVMGGCASGDRRDQRDPDASG